MQHRSSDSSSIFSKKYQRVKKKGKKKKKRTERDDVKEVDVNTGRPADANVFYFRINCEATLT